MATIIKTGWLTDFEDNYFAPKTLDSRVFRETDGLSLQVYLNNLSQNSSQQLAALETKINSSSMVVNLAANGAGTFAAGAKSTLGVEGMLDTANGGTGVAATATGALLVGQGEGQPLAAISPASDKIHILCSDGSGKAPVFRKITISNWIESATAGPKFQLELNSEVLSQSAAIPLASASVAGVVSADANTEQTFTGKKVFNQGIKSNADIDLNGNSLQNISGYVDSTNEAYYFIDKDTNTIAYINSTGVHSVDMTSKNYEMEKDFATVYSKLGILDTTVASKIDKIDGKGLSSNDLLSGETIRFSNLYGDIPAGSCIYEGAIELISNTASGTSTSYPFYGENLQSNDVKMLQVFGNNNYFKDSATGTITLNGIDYSMTMSWSSNLINTTGQVVGLFTIKDSGNNTIGSLISGLGTDNIRYMNILLKDNGLFKVGDIVTIKISCNYDIHINIPTNYLNIGTANKALITDANGLITASSVTSTELNYMSGVTSSIQTQLNNKLNNDHIFYTISDTAPSDTSLLWLKPTT